MTYFQGLTPEKLPKPNRKGSSSNHYVSGCMLNFGGVDFEGVYFFSMEFLNHLEVKKGDVPKEKVLRFATLRCLEKVKDILPNGGAIW